MTPRGKLALRHRGRAVVRPPPDAYAPLIDRGPDPAGHWYWLGEFYDNGLDRSAVFPWAPPAERPTLFMVPQLLWQQANPTAVSRTLLENTCGLYTCINPAHWAARGVASLPTVAVTLPEDVGARPARSTALGTVVHILYDQQESALCGRRLRALHLAQTTPITCPHCILRWVQAGLPFTEFSVTQD